VLDGQIAVFELLGVVTRKLPFSGRNRIEQTLRNPEYLAGGIGYLN
jgi:hypothetical protein